MYPVKFSHMLTDWLMILLVKWFGKHIHSPPELVKIKSLAQNLFIFLHLLSAEKKKKNYISINMGFHEDLFICLLACTQRCACVKRKLCCRIPAFISLVFFQSGIIRHEHDEFRSPRASYEAFQGEISDFFNVFFFFFPLSLSWLSRKEKWVSYFKAEFSELWSCD